MKPRVYVLLLFIFMSCRKESTLRELLVGTWELRSTYGGWSGRTDYPAGNGHIIVFTPTTYSSYNNGRLMEQATYTYALI